MSLRSSGLRWLIRFANYFFGESDMAFVTGRVWTGAGGSPPKEIALVYQLIGQIDSNFSEVDGLWYLIFTANRAQ
jgi:hypothetical protein